MTVLPAQEVGRRALRGAVALATRQAVLATLTVVGGVLLARRLTPAEFGVYAIAAFWLALLMAIGNAGLGGALIQQRDEPTDRDLALLFTVQIAAAGGLSGAAVVFAAPLAHAYSLSGDAVTVIRLFALGLFVQSLQAVPLVRLDRDLAFARVGLLGVVEMAVFQSLAVALAYTGFGVISFGIAVAAQAIVGAFLAWYLAPWRPRLAWEPIRLRQLLAFGIPYQGAAVVSLVKDSLTPTFVGILLGARAVGLVGWAQQLSVIAVILLMALSRLWMPTFSRLADRPEQLARAVQEAIHWTNTIVAPIAVILLVLVHPVTHIVFGDRWVDAIPLFYLLWPANVIVPNVLILLAMLAARGRVRLTFALTAGWAVLNWALGAPLVAALGINGYGWANLAVTATNLVIIPFACREAPIDAIRPVLVPWLTAVPIGAALAVVEHAYPADRVDTLVGYASAAAIAYFGLVVTTQRHAVRRLIALARQATS
jgi:O-antigen/teichoic acid export membrane protein